MTGKTGLVLDNIDTADPENAIAQEIAKILAKSDLTEEDRQRKDWLAFHGALYTDRDHHLVLPYRCVKRALRNGAYLIGSSTLSGKMDKGVESSGSTDFRIVYEGPQDARELYDHQQFRLRNMVRKGKGMVPYVRPLIPEWKVIADVMVFNDVISWDQFTRTVDITGQAVGVGNARKIGYGRFTAEVKRL